MCSARILGFLVDAQLFLIPLIRVHTNISAEDEDLTEEDDDSYVESVAK